MFISGFKFLQKKLDMKIKKLSFRKHGNNLKFKLRSYLKIEGDIREIKYVLKPSFLKQTFKDDSIGRSILLMF